VLISSWKATKSILNLTKWDSNFSAFGISITASKDVFSKALGQKKKKTAKMLYKFVLHKVFTPLMQRSGHSSCILKHQ